MNSNSSGEISKPVATLRVRLVRACAVVRRAVISEEGTSPTPLWLHDYFAVATRVCWFAVSPCEVVQRNLQSLGD